METVACFILVSVVALGGLALAYLVVCRLPKSDYREVEILAQNILAAWQQGNEFGRMSVAAGDEPTIPALTISPKPQVEPGPYDDASDETIISPASMEE